MADFYRWNGDYDHPLMIARYLRASQRLDDHLYPSDGFVSDDKEVNARVSHTYTKAYEELRDIFTEEELALIDSSDPVEVLDQW